ncbi:hypothetical protein DFJ73DRAFT_509695 [Zopfochytrium polystomum]|nr:hypothetical protein DFJ73DRAFT_509695 [Zopfochytrium polystomum]
MPLSISLNRSGDKRMRTAAKTRDDTNNYNGDSPAAAAAAVYRPPQANRPSPRRPSAGGGGGGSSGWLQPIWGLISPSPSPVGAAPTSPPSPPRTARNGRLSAMGSRSRSAHPSLSGTAASPPSPSALSLTSSPTSLDSAMDLPDSPPHSAYLSILPRESSLGRMNVPPFFNTDPPPPLPGAARFKTVTHPQVYRGSATNQVDVSETDPWVSVEHRWLALEERRLDLEERRLGLAARMLTLLETQAAQQPVVAQPSHEPVSVGKLVEPSLPVAAPATATATSTRNGAAANAAAAPKVAAVKSANDITDEPPMVFNSYCWRNSRTQVNSEIKQGQNKPSALQAVGPLDPRDVHKWLIDKGFESWLDVAKLGDGEPLFSQLVEALSRASIVVAYISDEYVKSDNCKKEWFFAKHQLKLAVIPVIVGDKPKSGDYPRWMLSEIGFDMDHPRCVTTSRPRQ